MIAPHQPGAPLSDDAVGAACPATCPRLPGERAIGLRHRFVEANGVRFHVVEAGPGDPGDPSRPLVLLLHGFPEFWYGWRAQIPALAARFRVAVPDLRGYNLSGKPPTQRGTGCYSYETLCSDVPALVRALGAERAHVVGHDWGGMIAWGAAMFHPEVVERLAILNAPHPAAFLRELEHTMRQWLRSWYVLLFQVPRVAEWLLTRGHARGVARLLRGSALTPASFSDAELAAYRRAISRPGAAEAALAYYRALRSVSIPELRARLRPVAAPTLLIWGVQDVVLVPELTENLEAWVPGVRVEMVPDASHWVQHERPERVNDLLLEHFGGVSGSG